MAQTHLIHQLSDCGVIILGSLGCFFAEPQDVGDHLVVGRARQIPFLRGQGAQVVQPILDPSIVDGCAKAHLGFDDRHVQLVKQLGQIGVGRIVEDDKPGIDRLIAILAGHDGTRMSPQPGFGLVNSDVVIF